MHIAGHTPDAPHPRGGSVDPSAAISPSMTEIESLKADVKHARGIYGNHAENMVAAGGAQRVLDKFTLNPDTACHHLTLEAPFPIYSVSVASTVPLDLLDVENDEAVCARSEPDPRSGTMALATL